MEWENKSFIYFTSVIYTLLGALNDLQISVNYTASAGDHIAPKWMVIGQYQLENEAIEADVVPGTVQEFEWRDWGKTSKYV